MLTQPAYYLIRAGGSTKQDAKSLAAIASVLLMRVGYLGRVAAAAAAGQQRTLSRPTVSLLVAEPYQRSDAPAGPATQTEPTYCVIVGC